MYRNMQNNDSVEQLFASPSVFDYPTTCFRVINTMRKSSCLRNSFNRKFRRKLLPSMNFALILQESQSNRFRVSIKDVPDLSKDFQYHCSRLCPFSLLAENLFLTMSKLSLSVRKCCHGNLCQAHGNLK